MMKPRQKELDYFRREDAQYYAYYRVPKLLFTHKYYKNLSTEAKILYGILLDRMQLSLKKQWFDEVHFGDWHFTASINPQPFRLKLKAKKFTNLKLTIKNEENSACTILNLVLQVDSFGYSK